jgi:hypothetical protein
MSDGYEYLVRGAVLKCSFGSIPNKVNLPIDHGVYAMDKPLLHANDNVPIENVPPFGLCSSPRNPGGVGCPCIPIMERVWQRAKEDTLINDNGGAYCAAITMDSYLNCCYGGEIKPQTSGQES